MLRNIDAILVIHYASSENINAGTLEIIYASDLEYLNGLFN